VVCVGVLFGSFLLSLSCARPSRLAFALASFERSVVLVALVVRGLNFLGTSLATQFAGAVVAQALLPVPCRRRDRRQRKGNHRQTWVFQRLHSGLLLAVRRNHLRTH